ncbi:MAG: hypothetical protein WCY06_07540 [Flavobacteriaceae bacterium]
MPLAVLFYKKRAFDKQHSAVPLIWLTALASLYEYIGTALLKININYWFQIYSFLELTAVYYFFYRLLGASYTKYRIAFLILLLSTYVVSFMYWGSSDKFISLAINNSAITVFVVVSVFLWFRHISQKGEVMNLWKYDNFYYVFGIFIYFSVTFCLFLLSKLIFESSGYAYDYWLANILATLGLRILLIIGVWKMKPRSSYFSGRLQ